MNNSILLGAYGWRHTAWLGHFYPDDLPTDWQLGYYSNAFECVLVPQCYWRAGRGYGCEDWLDEVHEDFFFYLEAPTGVVTNPNELELFWRQVRALGAQLGGVVVGADKAQVLALRQSMEGVSRDLPVLISTEPDNGETVCRDHKGSGSLVLLLDDLSTLRQTRQKLESVIQQEGKVQALIVGALAARVDEETVPQASQLMQLRAVMDIMGV